MSEQSIQTTSDERLMAALAHFLGLIVALIIWGMQKDKSRFVRFQAVQAMAFDGLIMVFFFFGMFAFMLLGFLGMVMILLLGVAAAQSDQAVGWITALSILFPGIPFSLVSILMLAGLFSLALRLAAAINVFQGKDFQYPWLGRQVKKFLGESGNQL